MATGIVNRNISMSPALRMAGNWVSGSIRPNPPATMKVAVLTMADLVPSLTSASSPVNWSSDTRCLTSETLTDSRTYQCWK